MIVDLIVAKIAVAAYLSYKQSQSLGLRSLNFFDLFSVSHASESNEEPAKELEAPSSTAKQLETDVGVDEHIVQAVIDRVKAELPSLIESLDRTPTSSVVSDTLDVCYQTLIANAQGFLNENSRVDLSRVKCLLRAMFPEQYHGAISENIKTHRSSSTFWGAIILLPPMPRKPISSSIPHPNPKRIDIRLMTKKKVLTTINVKNLAASTPLG